MKRNVVLIGMPGVGKSTVGVLLAKEMMKGFLDTDVYIQSREGKRLQTLLENLGPEQFCELEERSILRLSLDGREFVNGAIIATGGSVVYGKKAMARLMEIGVIVHLDLGFHLLEQRITNLATRGVVILPGQTLRDLYDERLPLYRQYAQLTVSCKGKTQEQIVLEVIRLAASRDKSFGES